jgi:hypothetical protein
LPIHEKLMLKQSWQSVTCCMFCQVLGPCLEPTRTENWHLWCVRALLIHNSDLTTGSLWMHFASDLGKKNPNWIWTGTFLCRIKGTEFRIIYHDENQAEVSFTRNWDPSLEGKAVPLNIDKRWVMHTKHNNSAILISSIHRAKMKENMLNGANISVQVHRSPGFFRILHLWNLRA